MRRWNGWGARSSSSCYHLAWGRARMLPVPDHARPVHPDVENTCRELMRILEGGPVRDSSRIEEHDVGVADGTEEAALSQAQPCGDCTTHLADGVLQRELFLLTDILRQYTGVCAIGTGMCWSQFLRPGGIEATCVRR